MRFEELNRNLYNLIPREEHDRVFDGTASAECSCEFLVCDLMYFHLSDTLDKNMTILDFGCGYNAQSYLFGDFKLYLGIDSYKSFTDEYGCFYDFRTYRAQGTGFLNVSGQKFIRDFMPKMNIDIDHTFAICTYVPSDELQELVRRTFKYCYVFYPN